MSVSTSPRGRRRDERGAISVVVAISAAVLLISAAFAVDIGNTWARRGLLQKQADEAAVFAANELPAYDAAGRTKVARAAVQFIACNPVAGQAELDDDVAQAIDSCTDGMAGDQTQEMKDLATSMLDDGGISFPAIEGSTGSYVKVITPRARITFGLGQAAGHKESIQFREAVARVGSPGDVAPMAMSLNCLLSAADNLPAGLGNTMTGVLPLNYIAPGPITADNVNTKWPTGLSESNGVTLESWLPTPAAATQAIDPGPQTVTGQGWGTVGLTDVKLVFALGDQRATAADDLPSSTVTGVSLVNLLGAGTVTVPPEVYNKVGVWKVKVAVKPALGAWTYSKQDLDFTVTLPTVTQDLLGCARMIKSPRDLQQGTPGNLKISLMDGLDHTLRTHPSLASVSLPSPLTTDGLLAALGGQNGLTTCDGNNWNSGGPNVYDNGGNHPVANCVTPEQGANTYKEFTDGILGPQTIVPENASTGTPSYTTAGRLVCTTAKPCQNEFELPGFPGVKINDDEFSDFILPGRENTLTESMFFNLDTYLNNDLPVVTPDSALSSDIYSSHRFMWVPVVSAAVNVNSTSYYPVLTFRPIFITQDAPPGLDSIDMVLDLVDTWVKTLLAINPGDDHGLLLDSSGTTLRALRFMTIEPSALPAADPDYAGPISNYLGTGPKVIRLVR